MITKKQQHENALREQFEDQLPELLEKERQHLREQFEENELPALLVNIGQQLRDQFEDELPNRRNNE